MRKRLFIALVLIVLLVPLSIAAKPEETQLRYDTTYEVGSFAPYDDERVHTWDGTLWKDGEYAGDIDWYMIPMEGYPPPTTVVHWDEAIVIITLGDDTIEIEEWGSTTWLLHKGEANWRANGIVTSASENYLYLEGRPIHDGGEVDLSTFTGVGKIHINK
jgi:hypothetical protein